MLPVNHIQTCKPAASYYKLLATVGLEEFD